ncbi:MULTISPECIES: hypothetical protein [Pseudanabaena]|uniref:Uncharacterized protein n=2 Tax=Pseudanabaena TaxID=1152 RepID=L8N571_9CYAN|nr:MULTISPECIES: hypothetical protein [Pseudanabaena]ELS34259.1 hypothetical protein Pse7429DRAFT_0551 [Pseudanabaena biceps PCC 7429]MDG3493556.1 hypothetical protein [Pseudanabaena catenata USMAC16]
MDSQEATIFALQNRIKYLEAHLHLALQVLREMEDYAQDSIESFESSPKSHAKSHTIDIVPTSKIELPTFLSSRTWRHQPPMMKSPNAFVSRDRAIANAS